jgi:hypothetical protein
MGVIKKMIPKHEWEKLSKQFEEWVYQKMTGEEVELSMYYGPSREFSGEFIAYCAGYVAGKKETEMERSGGGK